MSGMVWGRLMEALSLGEALLPASGGSACSLYPSHSTPQGTLLGSLSHVRLLLPHLTPHLGYPGPLSEAPSCSLQTFFWLGIVTSGGERESCFPSSWTQPQVCWHEVQGTRAWLAGGTEITSLLETLPSL